MVGLLLGGLWASDGELATVHVNRRDYDVPRMSMAGLRLLQQPTEGGSLWMAV